MSTLATLQMSSLPIVFLTGNANVSFASNVATCLSTLYGKEIKSHNCVLEKFSNGETQVEIPVSVRGCDVYVMQSTCSISPNDSLMELLAIIQAATLSDADRVTAVVPAFAYARQDRKAKARQPITAKLACDLIKCSGAQRLMTYDLHADQIQGFFDGPVDNLYAMNYFVRYTNERLPAVREPANKDTFIVVSPDAGGVKRAVTFANLLGGLEVAMIHKNRPKPGEIGKMTLVGSVENRVVLMIDDIADTCGTLCKAAQLLKENGAGQIYAFATHGVLSGKAFENLKAAKAIDFSLVVTDTIDVCAIAASKKISIPSNLNVISVAQQTAMSIRIANVGGSLSQFYNYDTWLQLFDNFETKSDSDDEVDS